MPTTLKFISIDDCTKMIRAALKQGFPLTKFSVRKTRSTYSHNIDVSWTDGPTSKQVDSILNRFESKGFDGMTDCEYSCGDRILCGVQVRVCGNYVSGSRHISNRLRSIVVAKLAAECGIEAPALNEYGNLAHETGTVPFQWHSHWLKTPYMTVEQFQEAKYILCSDSCQGEWFSQLMYRIESCISVEEQKPINAELLPEYIDINATVQTGRATEEPHCEPPQRMFEGHVALVEELQPVIPAEFHCSIGRRYAKPTLQDVPCATELLQ